MLFFELFPAFVAVVSIGVGLWLFLVERRARQNPAEPPPRRVTSRPEVTDDVRARRPGSGRPSMRS